MKAKFIYEEFKENSDPIDDMGIGTKGYSAYSEVWVVCTDAVGDIDEIYLNKEKAQRAADKINKDIYADSRKSNSAMSDDEFEHYYKESRRFTYRVMSLNDAIYKIRSNVRYEDDNY